MDHPFFMGTTLLAYIFLLTQKGVPVRYRDAFNKMSQSIRKFAYRCLITVAVCTELVLLMKRLV